MHLTRHPLYLASASLAVAALLSACGGGSASSPAPVAQASLTATAASITLAPSATTTLGNTGGSGSGAVTYSVVTGTCTVSGTTLTAPATGGTCTVTASKAGDTSYQSATSSPITLTVLNYQAALTASVSATSINAGGTAALSTTGGSGNGAVSYAVTSGTCTVSGSTLTAGSAAGTCAVTATKAADTNYVAMTSAAVSVTVLPPPQTTLVMSPASKTISTGSTVALSTTGGSGTGAVTYASTGGCTIAGATLTAPATASTCVVTATKAADSSYASATATATYAVTLAFSPVTVVQAQTASQKSYDEVASVALPGNSAVGGYDFNACGTWWSGVGTDSVYRGICMDATAGSGVGVYVKAAGTSTWSINGATSLTVGLGTNAECVGLCKATIILISATSADCKATIKSPFKFLSAAVNTGLGATSSADAYTSALTDANWTVSGCTANTMSAFTALALKEVHAQVLKADSQNSSGQYPAGVNLGAITFK